ncbi:hypothetical protein QFL40_15315 [Enterococcus faecalis]|uniref:hypothetical protein n=1 Tax=Enterococcus faecalis TaxID=1351 RepID=UPI002456D371|nr:hypothetical protein [Enterococcus faecalis]MDH5059327.1 hypothetical protein [Enterococcus faecalis]
MGNYFNQNISLAKKIKDNTTYLRSEFEDLKTFDVYECSEDTGVLHFISSYFASENIKLSDKNLIVSDMCDTKKMYVFLDKKIYVFHFDKEQNESSIEVLDNYKKISFTLNYDSPKEGIYVLNHEGHGFFNSDFSNVSSDVFKDSKNPEVAFVTLKLDFVDLKISDENSNLDIDSIIKYVEQLV